MKANCWGKERGGLGGGVVLLSSHHKLGNDTILDELGEDTIMDERVELGEDTTVDEPDA
jgi:hypothetical protein